MWIHSASKIWYDAVLSSLGQILSNNKNLAKIFQLLAYLITQSVISCFYALWMRSAMNVQFGGDMPSKYNLCMTRRLLTKVNMMQY